MLNTYIKNRGVTQTLIHNNNQNQMSEVEWDADYDGNTANILVNTDTNGIKQQYAFTLDENDLDNLLSIPSVQEPLHKRLVDDFIRQPVQRTPNKYYIELPDSEIKNDEESDYIQSEPTNTVEDLLQTSQPRGYLSSPSSDEEFIVPITINDKHHPRNKYTLTPKKHHRKKKTHNTYKIYKKHKSITKSAPRTRSSSKSKSKSKSKKRNNSSPFSGL
jgi:hypothetical protein